MFRTTALFAPLFILAACADEPETAKQEAGADATEAASVAPPAADVQLMPGKWRATSELVAMDVPGMPPEMAKANIGQKTTFENCITPEQARQPASDFFTNAENTNCTPVDYSMKGGKLQATLSCIDKTTPGKMTLTMTGDYTPTSYTAEMTMVTDGAPAGGEMKIGSKTRGERIGDCG